MKQGKGLRAGSAGIEGGEPGGDGVQRAGLQTTAAEPAVLLADNKSRAREYPQVLRNGRQRHGKRRGQLGNRGFALR